MEWLIRALEIDTRTKDRILFAALYLFALKGVAATSVKDIASATRIQAASLYNHYQSKDSILDAVIVLTIKLISDFYDRMRASIRAATNLDSMMSGLFREVELVVDNAMYFGVMVLASERFHNPTAKDVLIISYMQPGLELIDEALSTCIAQGWARQFDTLSCASLVMSNIMIGMMNRVNESAKLSAPNDTTAMFSSLRLLLADLIKA